MAWWAARPGRNPSLPSEKVVSHSGGRAGWMHRSSPVGMLRVRTPAGLRDLHPRDRRRSGCPSQPRLSDLWPRLPPVPRPRLPGPPVEPRAAAVPRPPPACRQELPSRSHAFPHRRGAHRRVLARGAHRRVTPSCHAGPLQRRPRCPAAVQPPGHPPAIRLGLPHARASRRGPRLTAAWRSAGLSPRSGRLLAAGCEVFARFPSGVPAVPRDGIQTVDWDTLPTSRRKTQNFRCVHAGGLTHTPPRMEDVVVAGPLVPGVPPLLSGSYASPHICGPSV
jgi:hypothetical protein